MVKILISIFILITILTFPILCINYVIDANDESIDKILNKNEFVLTLFYNTNSTLYDQIIPEFSQAAKEMRKYIYNLTFVQINSPSNSTLTNYNIKALPQIKLFHKGIPIMYHGGYLNKEIQQYLKEKVELQIFDFSTVEELNELTKRKEVVVFFGQPFKNNRKYDIFTGAVRQFDDVIFGVCSSNECLNHFNTIEDSVIIIKRMSKDKQELRPEFTETTLRVFLQSHITSIYDGFDHALSKLIFAGYTSGIFLYRNKTDLKQKKHEYTFMKVAKHLKGAITFVMTDITAHYEQQLAMVMKIRGRNLPAIFIHDATKEDIVSYRLDKEFSEENIAEFILDWAMKKNMTRYYASEEPPAVQTYPITTLVGKTFSEIVRKRQINNKNVLVYYYADTCEKCKSVTEKFEKLANLTASKYLHIVYSKMNGMDNEVEGMAVNEFPALKLFPAGNKFTSIDYKEKNVTISSLVEFLNANIKNKIEVNPKDLDEVEIDSKELNSTSSKNTRKEEI